MESHQNKKEKTKYEKSWVIFVIYYYVKVINKSENLKQK